ncbi:MAG: hypothetical protein HY313_04515 [Acidobacteria bacterium]|nr:hypothetical protein [Acidobacteriota bacterium]
MESHRMVSTDLEKLSTGWGRSDRPGHPDAAQMKTVDSINRMDWERVERLDWHLWILAILLIFVLGISLLSFMFPGTFWTQANFADATTQRAFFGFCVLLALVLVYLLQRQSAVRRLKRQLYEAQAAVFAAEQAASSQTFLALPGLAQFRDVLAMEYRRATTAHTPLAAALFAAPGTSQAVLGNMARFLRCLLRRGESLYRISDSAVAAILPGMRLNDAASLVGQVESFSGRPKGELDLRVTSYPEECESLGQLEERLRARQGEEPLF